MTAVCACFMKVRIIILCVMLFCCASLWSAAPAANDDDVSNMQAAFARFPKLNLLTNDAGEPAFQPLSLTNGFDSNGKIFYGFSFQVPHRTNREDLVWAFVEPSVPYHWYILPQTGDMVGFSDVETRSKADYLGADPLLPLPARSLCVQHLSGALIEDGKSYLIWFYFEKNPPPQLSLTFAFANPTPGDTNYGRAIARVLGLMHRTSRPVVNPANHHAYILLRRDNWQNSEKQAVALGGHLATVRNQAEEDWIFNTFGNYGGVQRLLWIGLSGKGGKTNFTWSSGESLSYTRWAPGAPANSKHGDTFVAIRNPNHALGGKWTVWHDQTQVSGGVPLNGVAEIIPPDTATNAANLRR